MAKRAFDQRIQLQWVVKDTANCSRFTQMHAKTAITDIFCLTGSYSLSCPARCASWEHLVALTTTDTDKSEFDALWSVLERAKNDRSSKRKASAAPGTNPYAKR